METYNVGGKEFSPEEIIVQSRKTAGWLGAITVFSIINLLLMLFKTNVSFIIGLGITQLVTAISMGIAEGAIPVVAKVIFIIGLVVNISIIGIYALLWWLSKKGSMAAYIIGMVLYLLDGFLFLVVQDWIGVGFHVFFLFMLFGGYQFMKKYKEAEMRLLEEIDDVIEVEPIPQESEDGELPAKEPVAPPE